VIEELLSRAAKRAPRRDGYRSGILPPVETQRPSRLERAQRARIRAQQSRVRASTADDPARAARLERLATIQEHHALMLERWAAPPAAASAEAARP
jgi:hypothetical protein